MLSGDDAALLALLQTAARMSTADKVKKAKKKPSGASALSFDMDDEGEAFAVKKSKKSRGHKHLKASGAAAPAVDTQVSSGVYTAEYLKQLRAETKFKDAPSSQAAEGPDDASEVVPARPRCAHHHMARPLTAAPCHSRGWFPASTTSAKPGRSASAPGGWPRSRKAGGSRVPMG